MEYLYQFDPTLIAAAFWGVVIFIACIVDNIPTRRK
jgi:hypothetical protein